MLKRFLGGHQWGVVGLRAPWGNRPSIYRHLIEHASPDGLSLTKDGETLPDDDIFWKGSKLRWVAGGLDGAVGGTADNAEAAATEIASALMVLCDKATSRNAAKLYELLTKHSTLGYIDALLPLLAKDFPQHGERLAVIARWLATSAADREAVKASIAVLGLVGGQQDRDLLLTLGRHEEFTLYVAVALLRIEPDPDPVLWTLTKSVHGWGRIQLIERLKDTESPAIKDWLLREGYENSVMREYTALICAQTGHLVGELRRPDPDDELLRGAGWILESLILGHGGPADGIEAYPDGPETTELYLQHVQSRSLDLEHLAVADVIAGFVDDTDTETEGVKAKFDWRERIPAIREHIAAIRSRDWTPRVEAALKSSDRRTFWLAQRGAKVLGMDIWGIHFERLTRGEDDWYWASETNDLERMTQVVRVAEQTLPLARIASGPADELGLGVEFGNHLALQFVLQGLVRFPGLGWPLVRTGLRANVTGTRNGAVNVIKSWRLEFLPAEARELLREAWAVEPNERAREHMAEVYVSHWGPIS